MSEGEGIEGFAPDIAGFTDSDFAGDSNDTKSTSGWVFMFNGAPISWASRKQGLVMRLSMEAELVAGEYILDSLLVEYCKGHWFIHTCYMLRTVR